MNSSQKYISVVETIQDCEALMHWKKNNSDAKLTIIALSLECLEWLRQKGVADVKHAWELLPMEDIIDKAFFDSEREYGRWMSLFKQYPDAYFELSSQGRLHIEFLQHAVASFYVTQEIAKLCKATSSVYLALTRDSIILSRYTPNNQKVISENSLFNEISTEYLKQQLIPIIYLGRGRFKRSAKVSFFMHALFEITHAIVDRLRGKPSLRKLLEKTLPTHTLISGWGKDISRSLDIGVLAKLARETNAKPVANVIWRQGKVRNLPRSTPAFSIISIRESIFKGVSYGPAFSLFSPSIWVKQLFFYSLIVEPRMLKLKKLNEGGLLEQLISLKSFERQFAYNVAFAYHEAHLARLLTKTVLAHIRPNIFIGSDADSPATRMELLCAKEEGVFTMSTPHGYQAYCFSLYNYLADKILTHGPATEHLLHISGVDKSHTAIVGTNYMRRAEAKELSSKSSNIIIATRSWGGAWSNYGSRQDIYDKTLNAFLSGISSRPKTNIIIKSHPNGDYDTYYDLTMARLMNTRVTHQPRGWKPEQFATSSDVLVCMGELPSLYVAALYLKIPIIFIDGAMTKTQAKLHYDYKGLKTVVAKADEAWSIIDKLYSDPLYYKEVMVAQNELAKGYDVNDPEKRLLELISQR